MAEAEAVLLELPGVFNPALVGIAARADGIFVAAYDTEKCIRVLMKQNRWGYGEALDWFEYNTAGGYMGDGTPVFSGHAGKGKRMNDIELAEHLVQLDGDKLVTDSLTVAKSFGKRHKNVLQAYDKLQCSPEFSRLNFQPSDYVDERGKPQRLVKMTKNGFMMLVMGFTGEMAMAFKEACIAAFNATAAYIAQHQQSLWQRMQALIARETQSKVKASYGSHLVLARKRKLPAVHTERADLDSQVQMLLLVL